MGFFDKLKAGLSKTREKLVAGFRSVLPFGKKIDEAVLTQLEETMLQADIGPATATKLVEATRAAWKRGKLNEAQEIVEFLKSEVVGMWPPADRELRRAETGPTVMLVVGINGSGKTTSIAKLARYLTKQGKKVIVAAADTYRAAAVEQLSIWAERTGVQIVKHKQGADPGAVAWDGIEAAVARQADYLIVDTAGRLHTQDNLMRELGKIQSVIQKKIPAAPHEVLLVLDATIGQNAVTQAKLFAERVKVSGIILAKLDGSAKGGVVISIRDQLQVPVKFVGLGETADDLEPFDPQSFAQALFSE
jgi:fused signal recognition particle receptor